MSSRWSVDDVLVAARQAAEPKPSDLGQVFERLSSGIAAQSADVPGTGSCNAKLGEQAKQSDEPTPSNQELFAHRPALGGQASRTASSGGAITGGTAKAVVSATTKWMLLGGGLLCVGAGVGSIWQSSLPAEPPPERASALPSGTARSAPPDSEAGKGSPPEALQARELREEMPPASSLPEPHELVVQKPMTRDVRRRVQTLEVVRPKSEQAPPLDVPTKDDMSIALTLVEQARDALRLERPERAIRLLDQLDAQVDASVLSAERGVTRILALCASGRRAQAEQEARHMFNTVQAQLYHARLRRSCVGDDFFGPGSK